MVIVKGYVNLEAYFFVAPWCFLGKEMQFLSIFKCEVEWILWWLINLMMIKRRETSDNMLFDESIL